MLQKQEWLGVECGVAGSGVGSSWEWEGGSELGAEQTAAEEASLEKQFLVSLPYLLNLCLVYH